MKKTVCLISVLLIIVFTALPVYAAKERVIDTADLLTAEEEQKLSSKKVTTPSPICVSSKAAGFLVTVYCKSV